MNTRQKLRHLRIRDKNGVVSNRGGATVAGIIDENGKLINFAVAYCHNKDNFNRAVGKIKATGRLHSDCYFSGYDWDGILNAVQSDLDELYDQHIKEQREKILRKIATLERKLKTLG